MEDAHIKRKRGTKMIDQKLINDAYAGNAEAQRKLAELHYYGFGGNAKDIELGLLWYTRAAENGSSHAQYRVGRHYYFNDKTEEDWKKAIFWLQKSAENGCVDAQETLAYIYHRGAVAKRDPTLAVYWYNIAIQNGSVSALHDLGNCYEDGYGVDVDYKKAADLYQQATDLGSDDAEYFLGLCYRDGRGREKDIHKAIQLLDECSFDVYEARDALGDIYNYGAEGLDPNPSLAMAWYKHYLEEIEDDTVVEKYRKLRKAGYVACEDF